MKRLPRWLDVGLAISFSLFLFGCAGSDWEKGLHKVIRVPEATPSVDEALGLVRISGPSEIMPSSDDGTGGLLVRKFPGMPRGDVGKLIKGELLRSKVFSDDDGVRPTMALQAIVLEHGGNTIGSEFHISMRYVLKNWKEEVVLDERISTTGKDDSFIWWLRVGKGQLAAVQKNINALVDRLTIALSQYKKKRGPLLAQQSRNKSSSPEPSFATKPSPTPKPPPTPPTKTGTTGSGFFVSKLGHIITNEHVVRDCGSVTVGDNANKQVTVSVVETDKRNDLALLKISSTKMASADTKSLIRKLGITVVPLASDGLLRSEDVELGEDVLVAGYPYGDIFSNTIKVTKGIVSANRGLGDDTGQF